MKKIKGQRRQGDVQTQAVKKLPEGCAEMKKDGDRVILAHGEVTGHAHEIAVPKYARLVKAPANDVLNDAYLVLSRGAQLKHQEHSTIELPERIHGVARQSEYSPEEIRRVAD